MWSEAARLLQPFSRRFGDSRAIDAITYRVGQRLSANKTILTTRLPSGSEIALDMRDHSHRMVFFRGVIEPETSQLFRRLVTSDTVLLDVGANAGYYSLLAADLGAREVHAFEPNPDVLLLLARTASKAPRFVLNPLACGDQIGPAQLFMPDTAENNGLATVSGTYAKSARAVPVQMTTIDAYCEEHRVQPTLMKVDAEGFEPEVLRGAQGVIERCRPTVLCEMNTDAPSSILTPFGYEKRRAGNFNALFVPRA